MAEELSVPVPAVPEVDLAPVQAPDAVHDVALVELHDRVLDEPEFIDVGEALKLTVGGGGGGSLPKKSVLSMFMLRWQVLSLKALVNEIASVCEPVLSTTGVLNVFQLELLTAPLKIWVLSTLSVILPQLPPQLLLLALTVTEADFDGKLNWAVMTPLPNTFTYFPPLALLSLCVVAKAVVVSASKAVGAPGS